MYTGAYVTVNRRKCNELTDLREVAVVARLAEVYGIRCEVTEDPGEYQILIQVIVASA
mgnify:CR=1 FL=1